MSYKLPKNAEIKLLDSHYKSDSFEGGRLFKPFFQDFCEQAFAVNLEAQKGLGLFPIAFGEQNAYASISYALHSLTPYVFSESPIQYKARIEGKLEKQDKKGQVDFWCLAKDKKFEAYIESKKLWLNIGRTASRKFDSKCNKHIESAFNQINRLKSAGVDKEDIKYIKGAVFKVALFQIPIYYKPKLKPEDKDMESAPKHLENLLAENLKSNMGLLLGVLDMRSFGGLEEDEFGECTPFNVLAAVVMQ